MSNEKGPSRVVFDGPTDDGWATRVLTNTSAYGVVTDNIPPWPSTCIPLNNVNRNPETMNHIRGNSPSLATLDEHGGLAHNDVPALPIVSIKDDRVITNSRDVAEMFGKRHDNVVRDIREIMRGLLKSEESSFDWFRIEPYEHSQNGRTYASFDMTRDGFTLLVMGYTGPKAMQFKIRYIDAFNQMEAALRERQAPSLPDFTDPAAAARAFADQYEQRQIAEEKARSLTYTNEALWKENAEFAEEAAFNAPKVEAFERLMDAEGCITSTDLARMCGMRSAQALHKELQGHGVVYPRKDRYQRTLGWCVTARYAEKGWHRTTMKELRGRVSVSTKWTATGAEAIQWMLEG